MSELKTNKIYVPPGLAKDFAKEFECKKEEAHNKIAMRVVEICDMYESGETLLYWSRFDRAALNSIFVNHLVSRDTKSAMLRALA